MPVVTSRRATVRRAKGRLAARTDNHALEATLHISSILLWVFYSLAALYVAYCNSFFLEDRDGLPALHRGDGEGVAGAATVFLERMKLSRTYSNFYYYFFPEGFDIAAYAPLFIRAVIFSAVAIGSTHFLANSWGNGGELLMVLAWALGVLSERFWHTSAFGLGSSASAGVKGRLTPSAAMEAAAAASRETGGKVMLYSGRIPVVPGWLWVVVAILTGFFSGVMCKAKDIADGKLDRGRNLLGIFDGDRADECDDAAGSTAEESSMSGGPEGGGGRLHHRHSVGGPSSHAIGLGERLYMVVPFCTGQWFAFILRNGWRGIIIENSILILTLGVIGYAMLSFKLLKEQVYRVSGRTTVVRYHRTVPVRVAGTGAGGEEGAADGGSAAATATTVVEEEVVDTSVDLIDLISKIFTTSFGAVALGVVAVNVFITSLAIPFLKAVFKLNALVSSVGILVELIVYEMA